jgi:hypothetical protein
VRFESGVATLVTRYCTHASLSYDAYPQP